MQSKKEKLRELKFSWKLLEELPGTVKEERKHWGLKKKKRLESLQGSKEAKYKRGPRNRTLRRSELRALGCEPDPECPLGLDSLPVDQPWSFFHPHFLRNDCPSPQQNLKCSHLLTAPSFPKPGQERVSSCHPLSLH